MGLTLDTGALLALETGSTRIVAVIRAAQSAKTPITVPTVVVLEWWRGQHGGPVTKLLQGCSVEALSDALARLAGLAVASVSGAGNIDAVVMASAAQRGDVVYTGDMTDMLALKDHFPSVKVLPI